MGLIYRSRRKLTPGITANLSKSGVSFTGRKGGLSVNSRGRVTVHLAKGLSWRIK